MKTFNDFKIKKQLLNALADLGLEIPTPIQEASYSALMGGSDFVRIAQTGTGKTMAYLLPILQDLKFKEESQPRVLIIVPTRELVIQIVEQIKKLSPYLTIRVEGVYGGSNNIKSQKRALTAELDIVVGTPRRVYDLVISHALRLKEIKKLVIDEVDIMLDFGYKTQLKNLFEHLPVKRQNILFSATMTTYVDELMHDFLINPIQKTIAISGTPLESIRQEAYEVPNFYTKVNLLNHLLKDKETFHKVLIFVGTKSNADRLAETLQFTSEIAVIHSSKEQNHRMNSIEQFENGMRRILLATDVIARGIDISKISTVISFNTPFYPENYIHRIGRTGRADQQGRSILFYNTSEVPLKDAIEDLMSYTIPLRSFPEEVKVSAQRTPEEKTKRIDQDEEHRQKKYKLKGGGAFHEKSAKNSKVQNEKKSYHKSLKEKYKKPLRRGDKTQNMKKKNKK